MTERYRGSEPRVGKADPILEAAKAEALRVLPPILSQEDARKWKEASWEDYLEEKRKDAKDGNRQVGNVTFHGAPPPPKFWNTKI